MARAWSEENSKESKLVNVEIDKTILIEKIIYPQNIQGRTPLFDSGNNQNSNQDYTLSFLFKNSGDKGHSKTWLKSKIRNF